MAPLLLEKKIDVTAGEKMKAAGGGVCPHQKGIKNSNKTLTKLALLIPPLVDFFQHHNNRKKPSSPSVVVVSDIFSSTGCHYITLDNQTILRL